MTTAEHLELDVEASARRVIAALDRPGTRAWLVGAAGSGRSTLLEQLPALSSAPCVVVDLRELDEPDAVIGAVYSLAAAVASEARRELLADWPDPGEGITRAARELDPATIVAVRLPRSWELRRAAATSDWEERRSRRAAAVLRAIDALPQRVLWVTGRSPDVSGLFRAGERVDMAPPKGARSLLGQGLWQAYADDAQRLQAGLAASQQPSPIAVRLAVGLLALGEPLGSVVDVLGTRAPVAPLADALARRLSAPRWGELRQAVSALMLARRPIGRSEVPAVTGANEASLPFLCDVVAYGDDKIRMHSAVKWRLGREMPPLAPPRRAEAHAALARYFGSLDGAPNVRATQGAQTDAWLEKVRSLDLTPAGRGEVMPSCREHFWTRARYLSIEDRDYAAAAQVYQACVERYPDDDYAWHYLGFNLERAGLDPQRARQAYEEAARREPANPWWNSRRVTFLIGQGKPRAAADAWEEAQASLDPEGDRIASSPWLAEQCHHWVARAWLEAGDARRAFAVLGAIPDGVLRESERLTQLRQQVLDAVEADVIGESVHPPALPVDQRWLAPRFLPPSRDGRELRHWFPGRVVGASAATVRLVYASRLENGDYQSFVTEIEGPIWVDWGLGRPERASGYVELGVYGEGSEAAQLVVHAERDVAPAQAHKASLPLAQFDRWRSAS